MPTLTTRLNRQWTTKMAIFIVVLLGFGLWGLADALYFYPRRGLEDASRKQWLYLKQAMNAGRLASASIPDPAARQGTLAAKRAELEARIGEALKLETVAAGSGSEAAQAAVRLREIQPDLVDAAALQWLDSLRIVGRLDKALTSLDDPVKELGRLEEKWTTAAAPKPLSDFDLPLQWFFTALGIGGAAYVLLLVVLPAKRVRYSWDPEAKRLTLPGGKSLVPADIADFDKRKWDKFYVFLVLKESAGGGSVRLDLLRHTPLEEWILEMERIAFPDRAPKPAAAAPEEGNPSVPDPNHADSARPGDGAA